MAAGLREVFRGHDLRFVDRLTPEAHAWCDALLIGGGSFLYAPLAMPASLEAAVQAKPIAYVGVGVEGDVHPQHLGLLRRAACFFPRSLPKGVALDPSLRVTAVTPDLAFAARPIAVPRRPTKRLLFVPNAEVLPHRSSPSWVRPAWGYFASEATQALDELLKDGWSVTLAPFCSDRRTRDAWACAALAAECEGRVKIRQLDDVWLGAATLPDVSAEFSNASVVATQRYHGAIVAALTSTPCVSVHHHDKLLGAPASRHVPYYGVTKGALLEAIRAAQPLPDVDRSGAFDQMRAAVENALG